MAREVIIINDNIIEVVEPKATRVNKKELLSRRKWLVKQNEENVASIAKIDVLLGDFPEVQEQPGPAEI